MLFQVDSAWVVHRIIGRRMVEGRILITTKGDNSIGADVPISADDVLGRAVAIQRGSKRIILTEGWVRWANWWIALLSGVEWFGSRAQPSLARASMLKATRMLVRFCGLVARGLTGLDTVRRGETIAVPGDK